ncbi:putative membrane protein [Janthinobacterium sp. HH01]|nr:surface-adhesin E family protein [Janthinobacterium sp. HH01]ELX10365.1 putative membrane protein [Janthinobacterium sp. HH01]
MNKPGLLAIILILMCSWAQAAQWAKVGSGGGGVFYIDKASIIKADKTRKVWSMRSFSKPQTTPEGKPYRSVKALHLYSCEDRTTVLLSQVFYPEAMGKGEPVENYKYEKFNPEDIVPDSPFDNALAAVCK